MKAQMGVVAVVTALVVAGTGAAGWQAQGTQATQAVVIKGRAPVSNTVLKVTLPRPTEASLPNGAHLMVLEDRRAPQVVFSILIPGAGGYYDPSDVPGLASVTAAMMREGTPTRTTQQIALQLETMAASVAVGAGISGTDGSVSGSSLTGNFGAAFDLAADILLNPTFPEAELARYKERTRASLIAQRSSAGFLAAELSAKVLYGSHPAGRVSPSAEALDKITRAMLVDLHRARYVPDHAIIVIAGDISMADARKTVDARLAGWKRSGATASAVSDPAAIGPAMVHLVARPNSVQTSLWVGTQAIDRRSPDYDVVSVMNQVIGGGPTGRLFTHLREEKGYTYGAYSGLSAGRFRGGWQASMDVRTEVTEPALRDLVAEVTRMRTELVPVKEFEDKKRSMVASFALSLESTQAVLNNHVTRWMYGLPADYWDKYPERIASVTQAQVIAAAKKYLAPERLHIVAVGDATKIGDALKQFGSVTTYDTNGRVIGK